MYAATHAATVIGVDAVPIRVEVNRGHGIDSYHIVGLPDGAVRESRVRIRSAIDNSGLWIAPGAVSVNLAPADIRKDGTLFDLPMALALLAASGKEPADQQKLFDQYMFVGELALDGRLRPVRGVLPLALSARKQGLRGIVVPRDNAKEAALVVGLDVVACAHLADAWAFVRGEPGALVEHCGAMDENEVVAAHEYPFDMRDVRGQETAKRALEIAAAGGHNAMMVGPPGSGKTMLSKRLLSILPSMSFEESLQTTKIYSVSGMTSGEALVSTRPFRAPHHTISDVGLVGGGTGLPRPGEISLAHHGILFLDELPEFRKSALEVLRQPLEDGVIRITRSFVTVEYPARFMLVASMNPCPCGYLGDPNHACRCPHRSVERYMGRISGPLMDRIDIQIEVPAVRYRELRDVGDGESSAQIRARVEAARLVQRQRLADRGLHCNAEMGSAELREFCEVDDKGHRLLERVVDKLGMSARAYARILKVARTIADIEGEERISGRHIAEAIQYRSLDRQAAELSAV